MKLTFATIHVTDLERSVKFYQEVMGLTVQQRFAAGPNLEIAFLADGQAAVELVCDSAITEVQFSENLTLGFATDSLDQAMEDVKAKGVEITAGPIQPNPQTRFFFINDPDGAVLQIVEQK